jgi:chromosomal replication initiation ATPase DnaA
LIDLESRTKSFLNLGIELPTDDLLRVIISKSFSDKQVEVTPKISEYIIKNIDR